ncbi:Triosephosphate isomerase [Buchnera aphidicola (Cinara pseudotaxifoliae)]|uniref:Triosephosphate isomerase n=1 Tax=Buchnera aphidicola (Cinara pseudotaxifoliae) TaxID=655384 RepID=A0A451DH27_9GAMM|nr:triose-phosphate isomerase [Buchnera aphidicola]VFP85912.1 Triosephosphate isomerase [Buchnera aphidicola (Cinara pseudotaxifoliae)]
MIKPIIVGNWKLNGTKKRIKKFSKLLSLFLTQHNFKGTIAISLPVIYSYIIKNLSIFKKKKIFLSAQNVDNHTLGSFTGEISPNMLYDMMIKYVIIGHSERRFNHQETNYIVANKFRLLKKENLIPILCIGETEQEKKDNKIKEICVKQIDTIFNMCGIHAFDNSIIAYEPIWAIGSHNSANPLKAQFVAQFIRQYINSKLNYKIKNFFIQYGGSVTKNNILELMSQKDIDGFLIGKASLKITEFIKILELINI